MLAHSTCVQGLARMMHLFSVHGEQSRELLKKLDDRHDASPQLTLAQVGLGQSRGYLQVRELPDGSPERRWCVLKDERLWFFGAPDSSKAGTSLLLELAVRAPPARSPRAQRARREHVLHRRPHWGAAVLTGAGPAAVPPACCMHHRSSLKARGGEAVTRAAASRCAPRAAGST